LPPRRMGKPRTSSIAPLRAACADTRRRATYPSSSRSGPDRQFLRAVSVGAPGMSEDSTSRNASPQHVTRGSPTRDDPCARILVERALAARATPPSGPPSSKLARPTYATPAWVVNDNPWQLSGWRPALGGLAPVVDRGRRAADQEPESALCRLRRRRIARRPPALAIVDRVDPRARPPQAPVAGCRPSTTKAALLVDAAGPRGLFETRKTSRLDCGAGPAGPNAWVRTPGRPPRSR